MSSRLAGVSKIAIFSQDCASTAYCDRTTAAKSRCWWPCGLYMSRVNVFVIFSWYFLWIVIYWVKNPIDNVKLFYGRFLSMLVMLLKLVRLTCREKITQRLEQLSKTCHKNWEPKSYSFSRIYFWIIIYLSGGWFHI